MICKVITSVWTSADIIKILLTLIDIVRIYNLKIKYGYGGGSGFALIIVLFILLIIIGASCFGGFVGGC
jgi:uncharacterized protein (TIGR01732 family)